jgi:hypothetical protein
MTLSHVHRRIEELGNVGAVDRDLLEVLMVGCDGIERFGDPRDGIFTKKE